MKTLYGNIYKMSYKVSVAGYSCEFYENLCHCRYCVIEFNQ